MDCCFSHLSCVSALCSTVYCTALLLCLMSHMSFFGPCVTQCCSYLSCAWTRTQQAQTRGDLDWWGFSSPVLPDLLSPFKLFFHAHLPNNLADKAGQCVCVCLCGCFCQTGGVWRRWLKILLTPADTHQECVDGFHVLCVCVCVCLCVRKCVSVFDSLGSSRCRPG